jgi:hypothetical protein
MYPDNVMPGFAGLRTDLNTWVIAGVLTIFWLLSLRVIPNWRSEGWLSVAKSLYGLVWLGFGLNILARFAMLSYNATEWGNGTNRLIALPIHIINRALLYCLLFWVLTTLAYAIAVRRIRPGPLAVGRAFTPDFAYATAVPVALLSSVFFYLIEGQSQIPVVLITPILLLANLYVVAAVIIWWDYFRRSGPERQFTSIYALVLLPALVRAVCSPYRENLAPILLIPLFGTIFAGRRPALLKIITASLISLLLLTTVISYYRLVKWEKVPVQELTSDFREQGLSGMFDVAWYGPTHRFHAFDSLLLTVALIPSLEPHSGRNVLIAPLIRGVVPRFVYGGKSAADASTRFRTRIWAFDDPVGRETGGASIAPSMPGDLYDAGGVLYVVLGGSIWGLLLGLVDGWKRHLPSYCAAAVIMLVATQCFMSVERDFDNSVATFIQTLLVFMLVSGVVALARRDESHLATEMTQTMPSLPALQSRNEIIR